MGRALAEIHQKILRELPETFDIKTLETVVSKYYTLKTIQSMIKKGYIEKTSDNMYRKKTGWEERVHQATITPITRRTKAQMQCREQDDMPAEDVQIDEQQDNDDTMPFLDDDMNVILPKTTPAPAGNMSPLELTPADRGSYMEPVDVQPEIKRDNRIMLHLQALAAVPKTFRYSEYCQAFNSLINRDNKAPSIKPLLDRGLVKNIARGEYERTAMGAAEIRACDRRDGIK